GQRVGMNLHDSLTEEQQTALHDKVTEMREAGATREEIQKARREMLEGYGVELPERTGEHPGLRRPGLRGLCADLTEDQRAEIRAKVTEMKEAGAEREEIREAVGAMLEGYGVELPDQQDDGAITPSARIAATTAVQSASWGQIKSRMK
ncbi:MAG: hypothetical protein J7M27_07770, partial [Candidatus Latescibacteria bacterium]|nr:hypothetical protein [Candidatus Latescibacterota bacterium]